jgi:hypothetical protein
LRKLKKLLPKISERAVKIKRRAAYFETPGTKTFVGIHSLTAGKDENCFCLLMRCIKEFVAVALSNSGDIVGIKTVNKYVQLLPKIQFSNRDRDCTQYPDLFAVLYSLTLT